MRLLARLTVALGMLAGLCVGAAASDDARSPSTGLSHSGGAHGPSAAELVAAERAVTRRIGWLNGSAARVERRLSRTAFRGRLGRSAQGIAQDAFGRMVTGPMWQPPHLRAGERMVRMLSDRTMAIERNGTPAGVVDSSVPLQATAPDGSKRPTDLSLVETAESFVPVNPLVPVRIPRMLNEGVHLPGPALTVTATMPHQETRGALIDDRVFYPDAATDTDIIVGALPGGAAIYYQLRSPVSPDSFELTLTLPPGGELRSGPRGSADVVEGTITIARVEPPVALDAQGQSVPTRYVLEQNRIRVEVAHAGGDYAYPILLDPLIDSQDWQGGAVSGPREWFFAGSGTRWFAQSTGGSWGAGMYIGLGLGNYYAMGDSADWRYPVPGTGFVYRAEFSGERQETNSPSQAVCMSLGLVNNHGYGLDGWDNNATWYSSIGGGVAGGTGPRTRCNTFQGTSTLICLAGSNCSAPSTHSQVNYPKFMQWTYGDSVRDGWNLSYIGAAAVYMYDPENPNISGGPPASATDPDQVWTLNYGDPGLGVKYVELSSPGNDDWSEASNTTIGCTGTNSWRCPVLGSVSPRIGNLPPGTHTIRAKVTDAAGRSTTTDWPVSVGYFSSIRYGGANQTIDTDAEIQAATSGMATGDVEHKWAGLKPEDMQTLAAADAFVTWGEEPALNDGNAPQGTWSVDGGETPVPDNYIPTSDVIETYPADPTADSSGFQLIPIVAGTCFRYCDDAFRAIFKGGKGGVKKVKRGLPRNRHQLQPHRDWVKSAGRNSGQKLSTRMENAGRSKPSGYDAHHIVAATSRYAAKAQTILARCGLGANDARNGLFLPKTRRDPGDVRPGHGTLHTQNYFHNVNEIISTNYYGHPQSTTPVAQRCEKALEALEAIRQALLSNKFPY